jgi:hypothetical protein
MQLMLSMQMRTPMSNVAPSVRGLEGLGSGFHDRGPDSCRLPVNCSGQRLVMDQADFCLISAWSGLNSSYKSSRPSDGLLVRRSPGSSQHFETNSRLSFELRPRIIGAVNDAGGKSPVSRGKKAQLWRAPEASPRSKSKLE